MAVKKPLNMTIGERVKIVKIQFRAQGTLQVTIPKEIVIALKLKPHQKMDVFMNTKNATVSYRPMSAE